MPFNTEQLRKALVALQRFRVNAISPYHERYSFPFFCGTYFAYRWVDVMRTVAIAKSFATDNPSYLDVGCGYGDFLNKIRGYIPQAMGIEKDAAIFYELGITKPDYIKIADAVWIDRCDYYYDLIFVGWMEPGQDYRAALAKSTDVIVTTLDQGLSLAAEFDGHGFDRVACWKTPSWEDVNTEIMNRYYTKMPKETRAALARLRGAHNLWYVYSRPYKSIGVKLALEEWLHKEPSLLKADRYAFEETLDDCGYGYLEELEPLEEVGSLLNKMWQVHFDK